MTNTDTDLLRARRTAARAARRAAQDDYDAARRALGAAESVVAWLPSGADATEAKAAVDAAEAVAAAMKAIWIAAEREEDAADDALALRCVASAAVEAPVATAIDTAIDAALVRSIRIVTVDEGAEKIREYPQTSRTRVGHKWAPLALRSASLLSEFGALPGMSAVPGYSVRATATLADGTQADVTLQLLSDGWQQWLGCEREFPDFAPLTEAFRSTPERDFRIALQIELENSSASTEERIYDALQIAIAAEDAAMAARIAAGGVDVPVVPVIVSDAVAEVAADAAELEAPLEARDYPALRAARDAAEAAERAALAAFLVAQEARRLAQQDPDEVLATAELWGAPEADEGADKAPISPEEAAFRSARNAADAAEQELLSVCDEEPGILVEDEELYLLRLLVADCDHRAARRSEAAAADALQEPWGRLAA